MDEIDNGPLSYEDLGKAAVKSVVKMMAIKWAVIFTVTKLAQRAARNMEKTP